MYPFNVHIYIYKYVHQQVGLVDAVQLEQIICGVDSPVDARAIHAGATEKDWLKGDAQYVQSFWEVP